MQLAVQFRAFFLDDGVRGETNVLHSFISKVSCACKLEALNDYHDPVLQSSEIFPDLQDI